MKTKLLANELGKHYKRVGNKIIFSNGMTLNHLALEMWERLGYKEIDPSVLSRVLTGERVLNFRQLSVFAEAMKIKKQEKENLKRALYEELAHRYGLEEDFFRSSGRYFVELVNENINQIHTIRMKDEPAIAGEWADNVLEKLNKEIYIETDSSRKAILIEQEGLLMIEKMHASLATSKPTEIVKKGIEISTALEQIASVSKNPRFYEEALLNLGAINYLTSEYQKTILPLEKVVSMNIPVSRKALSLRMIMLSSAYTRDITVFNRTKTVLMKNISHFSESLLCEIFEGLARSSAILGKQIDAGNFLDKSWRYLSELQEVNGEGVIFRKLQLIRTEVEVFRQLKVRRKPEIEKLGLEGLEIAKKYGYNRYEVTIKTKLDLILN